MSAYAFDPLVLDLTRNPLSAKVKSDGVTADSDGFYYKTGQLVEITGDEQVGIATNAGKAAGILRSSRNTQNTPQGISKDNVRVDVTFIGYRYLMRLTAEGSLTAGTKVCQGTVSKQAVKAMSSLAATGAAGTLAATITAGEVDVVGDAAQPTVTVSGAPAVTLAGGILPENEIGIVWKGAADGAEALVLVK
ncbi:MAG: hypothetical protein JXQ82_07760 [Methanomicrobiaceae archaeon]|nr:hypothetical protein [Methanomicrobiaceae archaeon]